MAYILEEIAESVARTVMPSDYEVPKTPEDGERALGIISFGEFLEVYFPSRTVRINPETGRGTEKHIPMVMTVEPEMGSRNRTVARLILQSDSIVARLSLEESKKKSALLALLACKDALINCEKIANHVAAEVKSIFAALEREGVAYQGNSTSVHLPQVLMLAQNASNYLVSLRRATRAICEVAYWILELPKLDNNFDHLGKTLEVTYGQELRLTQFIRGHAKFVRYVSDLRNGDEHTSDQRSWTVVRNIHSEPGRVIRAPIWYLDGENKSEPRFVAEEMIALYELARDIAEQVVLFATDVKLPRPWVVTQLKADQVDPDWPVAYRVVIDPSALRVK